MRGFTFVIATILALGSVSASQKKIVCYVGTWATYRPDDGKFEIENIDPTLCTHLIYSFVALKGNDISVEAWKDLPNDGGKDGLNRFNALRKKNPNLKTLVAIGGWNERSEKYSKMASTAESREEFAKNAVAFVKKYKFDGFDLDWEYPAHANQGGVKADYQNYVELLKVLKYKLEKEGLLLSAAVAAAESTASNAYNIPEVSKYLDFINIMAYDLKGSYDKKTGMNAGLKPSADDTGNDLLLTVEACVNYWLNSGAPKEKIILGVPFYGRSFTLVDPKNNKIGSPITGPGLPGPYTREAGMLGYNEICEMHLKEEWDINYDQERCVPYSQKGNQWISFDNIDSIIEKANFINELDLGGVMVWSLETDDFRGKCGDKYPLLNALNDVLKVNKDSEKPVSTTSRPSVSSTNKPSISTTAEPSVSTNKVPTSEPGTPFVCPDIGNYADPESCDFYQCTYDGRGGYRAIKTSCPVELCWNSDIGVCDWRQF